MKAASVKQLKDELKACSQPELLQICLRLSKFKKENKELLTYLIFESEDEASFIASVKEEMGDQFKNINSAQSRFIKKGMRKILNGVKKHVRYSGKTETEVELLLHFLLAMKGFKPSYTRNRVLENMFNYQLQIVQKRISTLHEDLQHDYKREMEELNQN